MDVCSSINIYMKKVRAFIKKTAWVFAKTYAKIAPHEYVVRSDENSDEFAYVVAYIREHGYKKMFWQKEYIYLDVDGYTYWTMGNPVDQTTVLNRAKL